MSDIISYKLATKKDIPEFFPFFTHYIKTLFPEYTNQTLSYFVEVDYKKSWLSKVIASRRKILFLAKSKTTIVGFILFNKVYGGVSTASWLAVDPSYQKRGIGTNLLNLWEKYTLNNGGHSLQLWTTDKKISFYEKNGFTNAGIFPAAWFGIDMPMMHKKLCNPTEKNYLKDYLLKRS